MASGDVLKSLKKTVAWAERERGKKKKRAPQKERKETAHVKGIRVVSMMEKRKKKRRRGVDLASPRSSDENRRKESRPSFNGAVGQIEKRRKKKGGGGEERVF